MIVILFRDLSVSFCFLYTLCCSLLSSLDTNASRKGSRPVLPFPLGIGYFCSCCLCIEKQIFCSQKLKASGLKHINHLQKINSHNIASMLTMGTKNFEKHVSKNWSKHCIVFSTDSRYWKKMIVTDFLILMSKESKFWFICYKYIVICKINFMEMSKNNGSIGIGL